MTAQIIKLCPKLIVEGTRLTGKTDLALAYSWIIDRFHVSTQMWQTAYRGKTYQFGWLEQRLAALGFRLIFCWRHPKSFEQARKRRLQISSNPSQYENLENFIREQEIFQELVLNSAVPKLVVDVTNQSLEEQIDLIADWLGTGLGTGQQSIDFDLSFLVDALGPEQMTRPFLGVPLEDLKF